MTTETLPQTAPAEPTTPIKPSEAIRLGCLLAPVQAFDCYFADDERTKACVMGAMSLGYGGSQGTSWAGPLDVYQIDNARHGPVAEVALQGCPNEGCSDAGWPSHLNDAHRWSRERIADWLEGLGL